MIAKKSHILVKGSLQMDYDVKVFHPHITQEEKKKE